jgi:N,N'-diacetyllegionaminate synthase
MYIIAELCGQHGGRMRVLEQMILQAKMNGADAVKVQLYDTYRMPGENRVRWEYLGISFDQLKSLKAYCDMLRIDLFASFFDEERLNWCIELDFPILKIASFILKQWPDLAEKAVATGRRTIISLGMYDWQKGGAPFKTKNVEYLYCVPKYPGTLEDLGSMPDFRTDSLFCGYSDHTPGNAAVYQAISKGAKIIEKHFTLSHALQRDTEKGHFCSMDAAQLRDISLFALEQGVLTESRG